MAEKIKKPTNPFQCLDVPEHDHRDFGSIDKDIVEYETYDAIVKTGDGEEDYILEPRVRECARYNRQEYLNSQSNDVGILNIIKKVQMSGDNTLLQQRTRASVHTTVAPDGSVLEDVQDYTGVQTDIYGVQKATEKAQASYDGLHPEIKAGTSMRSLAELSDSEIMSLIARIDAAKAAKAKEDKGE